MSPIIIFADRFFGILPLFVITYHVLALPNDWSHAIVLFNITITYFQSAILKGLFKRARREKTYEFTPYFFSTYFHHTKSGYGFPSSHSMFYFQYFLNCPSVATLFLFICGSSLRIFCEHHYRSEVFFGCAVVLISKILIWFGYLLFNKV